MSIKSVTFASTVKYICKIMNNIAVIFLIMSVFEKKKRCIFRVPCFICRYFLGYQIGLKLAFF